MISSTAIFRLLLFYKPPLLQVLAVSKQKANAQTSVTPAKKKYSLVITVGRKNTNSTMSAITAKTE
jgi:hypothetical protein